MPPAAPLWGQKLLKGCVILSLWLRPAPSEMPVRLTLLGRSTLLLSSEILANAICWIVAVILFAPKPETRSVLSLSLLAWTLGLRHALDADHISAIDNSTRGLINLGQLPVTCGLFFSIGHSTIVLVVTVAIAISSDVFDRMHRVGEVGGIVGAAVSGSFLFIVGLANTIILWKILKRRRMEKKRAENGPPATDGKNVEPADESSRRTLTMRIIGPVMTFVNRPWKMYPVGVLFGLGFDTASSIALLAISVVAKRDSDGKSIPSSHIVILPLIFAAGMSLVDSFDSVIMLYSYTGFPERGWKLFEFTSRKMDTEKPRDNVVEEKPPSDQKDLEEKQGGLNSEGPFKSLEEEQVTAQARTKTNVMSGLSIILTVMSIVVAFSISLITIMGLIGENCAQCVKAAAAVDGGGLAGRWWRAWAAAGDQSGWIGIGIVGGFMAIVAAWYGGRWIYRRTRTQPADNGERPEGAQSKD